MQNWVAAGLEQKLAHQAAQRTLDDLTVGPVLTVSVPPHPSRPAPAPPPAVAFPASCQSVDVDLKRSLFAGCPPVCSSAFPRLCRVPLCHLRHW